MSQTPARIAETLVAKETLEIMMLAFKDMGQARKRAARCRVFDLDSRVIKTFLTHPMPSIHTFARELMLTHFPDQVQFDALKDFLDSSSVTVRDGAKRILMLNHPGKLSDTTLHEFANSMNASVHTLANEVLNERLVLKTRRHTQHS